MVAVPELIILNVGHGNCAILRDTKAITVIDCGYDGLSLIETLIHLNVDTIDHVIISHADRDHSGGLKPLLETFPVHHLYLNADASKKSRAWQDIALALDVAENCRQPMSLHSIFTADLLRACLKTSSKMYL